MEKRYDHTKYESEIYKMWEESGTFTPKGDPNKKHYTILMPPPNANASLHAGHAMYTIDDVLIRWKRMQDYLSQWLPGTDHAGFETQYVYENHLRKFGKSRLDYNRETLYKNIYKFVKENSGLIYDQFKQLGFSANWKRSVFTLDPHVVKRVYDTFEKMESEDLVYRDDYIVNYCTHCGTTLAELEVKHVERLDPLYYMRYGPFTLATVRPETKFGDTAVAVHPDDKRYIKYINKEVEIDGLIGKFKLKVIADKYVDPEFGTGVVKVTPAHDKNDYEAGKRHNLEVKSVIDLDGKLNEHTGKYAGLSVKKARKKVALDLKKKGLIEKMDRNYEHSVAVCYKCGNDIEPTIIPNWFIKVDRLKKEVEKVVKDDKIKFYPKRYKRHMLVWLDVMHDWPISRQIVWGIRIPAWYDTATNNLRVTFLTKDKKTKTGNIKDLLKKHSLSEIENGLQFLVAPKHSKYTISAKKPGKGYIQETDTFDTWFSSGQWPLVTLKEKEYKNMLPTDVMGTLSDILKLWVSRMILFSLYLENKIPFKNVYLWSMVADEKGVKMSKSKGNVVNPIDLVEKFGADALRMALIFGVAPGAKVPLSEDKIRGMRNFANKIWNMARFLLIMLEDEGIKKYSELPPYSNKLVKKLNNKDKSILNKLNKTINTVDKSLKKYRFAEATDAIYHFMWNDLASSYIEDVKKRNNKEGGLIVLRYAFINSLKLLHPFMPFVTESVWLELKNQRKFPEQMLITSSWPKV